MSQTTEIVGLAVALTTLLGALVAWLRWVRPRFRAWKRDGTAIRDALLGRPAVVDTITGRELAPELPGIGQRMASQETAQLQQQHDIAALAQAVATLVDVNERLTDHEDRITVLERAAVERVVARSESAQAWRTIEAAITARPEDDEPPADERPDLD